MEWLLRKVISSLVHRGRLNVTCASGRSFACGPGTGRTVAVRSATPKAQRDVLLDPELKLGEAFMDGTFVVESGTIADFLDLTLSADYPTRWSRALALSSPSPVRLRPLCRRWRPRPAWPRSIHRRPSPQACDRIDHLTGSAAQDANPPVGLL